MFVTARNRTNNLLPKGQCKPQLLETIVVESLEPEHYITGQLEKLNRKINKQSIVIGRLIQMLAYKDLLT